MALAIKDASGAQALLERVYKLSKADVVTAELEGGERAALRWANNSVTANLVETDHLLRLAVRFGAREAQVSTNQLDDDSLRAAVAAAERAAREKPENPELLPPLAPPLRYPAVEAYVEETAAFGPAERARAVRQSVEMCAKRGLVGAGYLPRVAGYRAFGNSKGVFAFYRYAGVNFVLTVRTPDGRGSGYARDSGVRRVSELKVAELTERACRKAEMSRQPQPLEPGEYAVIMEPVPAARYLALLLSAFDARAADEGRSYFSEKERGKNRLGQKLFGENITIRTDPQNSTLLANPVGSEGLPVEPVTWIEKGVLKNLAYSRFWAVRQKRRPTGFPAAIVWEGGAATVEEMVRATKRGLLISDFWYIRPVDPMKILFTGLTRNGLFLIENGKIAGAVNNFRWNDSPAVTLNHITMLGRPERAQLFEHFEDEGTALVPAFRAEKFTMSSVSPAT